MESGSLAARLNGAHWRLWALLPIVALVGIVALFVSTGSSLVEMVGQNPPPADEVDIRRVELRPGEIKIRVTNPQRDDITIATVTQMSRRRRPIASAIGPDSSVKTPKNTTPMICIVTKSVYANPRPG